MYRISVLTSRYPSADSPYNHMFVHTRNRQYLRLGFSVEVYVPSAREDRYEIDGVVVFLAPASRIADVLSRSAYDAVFFHLLHHSINPKLDGGVIYDRVIAIDMPCLFFVHGIDVQRIARSRPADIKLTQPKSIARFLYRDFWVFARMRQTVHRLMEDARYARFVCVSDWIHQEAEQSMKIAIGSKAAIIPNGIDTTLFSFDDHWPSRHQLLTIRPLLFRGVSALDLAIETMSLLRPLSCQLAIHGQGPDKRQILNYIAASDLADKVMLYDSFLPHACIPDVHKRYGIYYATTRMDSQGVSMCEAMSSGLPVVSFATCAIPEFVSHGYSGFLAQDFDVSQAAGFIEELLSSESTYRRLAANARESVERIDIALTCQREIDFAKKLVAESPHH